MSKQVRTTKPTAAADDAVSWETERVVAMRRSARTAWYVASAACLVALAAVFAVAGLTPLKQVTPFVIRVDKATGIVDVVKGLKEAPATYGSAVTRYFATQYLYAREGYSRALASHEYKTVGLMSSNRVAKAYFAEFSPRNPQSPLNLYGKEASVDAHVVSISFLTDNLLSIRFVKTIKRPNQSPDKSHWIATMKFRYSKAPMQASDRLINPLGFLVTEYRVAPETVRAGGGQP